MSRQSIGETPPKAPSKLYSVFRTFLRSKTLSCSLRNGPMYSLVRRLQLLFFNVLLVLSWTKQHIPDLQPPRHRCVAYLRSVSGEVGNRNTLVSWRLQGRLFSFFHDSAEIRFRSLFRNNACMFSCQQCFHQNIKYNLTGFCNILSNF